MYELDVKKLITLIKVNFLGLSIWVKVIIGHIYKHQK